MDYFSYKQGRYHAEDVDLTALAEKVGTPFYCYSSATIERHYQVFADSLKALSPKICYAVKANAARAVIATLARAGAGADVVSEGEIRAALAAGVKPENIVFSGVAKTAREMAYALEQNIFQFNVESEPELSLLNDVATSKGTRARIAIRANPDVVPETHAKISTGMKTTKFGVPFARARELYALADTLPGIETQGISVHIGSQLTSLSPFEEAFKRVRAFTEELRSAGHAIRTVDLGGGLGVPYDETDPPTPDKYAEMAVRVFKDMDAEFIFEPGRLIVANAGILVTQVIYVKHSEGKIFVITDAGMNDLIRPTLYDAHHTIVPVKESVNATPGRVDIVGPVCETGDIFAADRNLPMPAAGDLLAVRTCGAYGATMASTYNIRPLIAEVMVSGNQHTLIRPRQTYDEYFERERLPEWLEKK